MAYVASRYGGHPVVVHRDLGLVLRMQPGWRLLRDATEAERTALGNERQITLAEVESRAAAAAVPSSIVNSSTLELPLPEPSSRRPRRS
jgi:hypothetical protein